MSRSAKASRSPFLQIASQTDPPSLLLGVFMYGTRMLAVTSKAFLNRSFKLVFSFAKEAMMLDGFAATPHYVLRDGLRSIGPAVMQTSSAPVEFTAIFGFSDKPQYDAYLHQDALALTPYPLVKGFLQNQIDLDSRVLRLVVLDASNSRQRILPAATVQSILESFNRKLEVVEVTHELIRDERSGRYRIQSHRLSPTEDAIR